MSVGESDHLDHLGGVFGTDYHRGCGLQILGLIVGVGTEVGAVGQETVRAEEATQFGDVILGNGKQG
jgi:hypothetical protein